MMAESGGEVTTLISRFNTEEFNKTRSWLERLEAVITDVIARTASLNEPFLTGESGGLHATTERLDRFTDELRTMVLMLYMIMY